MIVNQLTFVLLNNRKYLHQTRINDEFMTVIDLFYLRKNCALTYFCTRWYG